MKNGPNPNDSCLNQPLLTLREGAAPHFHRQLNYNQRCPPDLIKTTSHLPFKQLSVCFLAAITFFHLFLPFVLYELMTLRPLCGLQIVPTCVLNINLKHKTTTTTTKSKPSDSSQPVKCDAGVNSDSRIIAVSTVSKEERAEVKAASLLTLRKIIWVEIAFSVQQMTSAACLDGPSLGTGSEIPRTAKLATRQGGGITFLICFVLLVSAVSYHIAEAAQRSEPGTSHSFIIMRCDATSDTWHHTWMMDLTVLFPKLHWLSCRRRSVIPLRIIRVQIRLISPIVTLTQHLPAGILGICWAFKGIMVSFLCAYCAYAERNRASLNTFITSFHCRENVISEN